jgi:hypothetical protein
MARDMLLHVCSEPTRTIAYEEKAMLALTLFFVAGILLGLIGLRLLSRWEAQSDKRPTIFRHHS